MDNTPKQRYYKLIIMIISLMTLISIVNISFYGHASKNNKELVITPTEQTNDNMHIEVNDLLFRDTGKPIIYDRHYIGEPYDIDPLFTP